MRTIRIIHDEHRSLAAVLHGMLYLVREIRERGAAPNFELFDAMIYYIDAFPERFHHPKEDRLFARVRQREPAAATLIDRLEDEHRKGAEMIRAIEQAQARYRQGGPGEFAAFAASVEAYAAFHWQHMRAEEQELLPLAQQHLAAQDWEAIDALFLEHGDPLFGADKIAEYATLFRRIVNLAPPPIGVGPEARRLPIPAQP